MGKLMLTRTTKLLYVYAIYRQPKKLKLMDQASLASGSRLCLKVVLPFSVLLFALM